MKNAEIISTGANHTAVDIGDLSEVSQYSMIHPRTGNEIRKIFVKELTGATGTEISFQTLPSHTELPYFHIHNKNEEIWIILKGEGKFQVDGHCFPVKEGSVVRIAPGGARGINNTSPEEMIYMVIQALEGSLQEYSSLDGRVVDVEKKW